MVLRVLIILWDFKTKIGKIIQKQGRFLPIDGPGHFKIMGPL